MAITPNVPAEQGNKTVLRANTRGGNNVITVFDPVDPALMVNAFTQASGVLRLTGVGSAVTFSISGSAGGNSATLTGSTGKVSDLVTALGNGPLASIPFFVNAGPSQFLKGNTGTSTSTGGAVVDIIVPSGVVLTIISGTGGVQPTITAVALTGTLGSTYPSYVGIPNATPTWIDDVTVHSYSVGYAGIINNAITLSGQTGVNTANTVQSQVRQISTLVSETQEYDGYFATYSGNLAQTGQKRTYRQQS